MIRIATATCIQNKLPNKYRYYFIKIWYAYHAAHWKGLFAAVDFLKYRWKHLENNKDNKNNFWSLYNHCKIWMPWLILIKFIRCHFLSREKTLIHQIQNSKFTSLAKSSFWCAALTLISALFSWRNVSSNTHQMWHNIFVIWFNNYVLFLIEPSGSKPL